MQSRFKDLTFLKLWVSPSHGYKVCSHYLTQKIYRFEGAVYNIYLENFHEKVIDRFSLVEPAPIIDLITKKHFNNLSTYMSLGEIYE